MISVRSEVQVLPGPPGSEDGIQMTEYGQWPGAVAQLGERVLCKHEVVGSIPSGSTMWGEVRDERSEVERPLRAVQKTFR